MNIIVSPLTFIMLAVLIATGYSFECLSYLLAVVLHEFAHAEISSRLGYKLLHIKIMPYGACLTGKYESVSWKDELKIALAGPAFNLAAALMLIAMWWLAPTVYFFTEQFVFANVYTAVFNLLPIFPLDGGRALLAVLSSKIPRQKAYKRLKIAGYIFTAVFAAFFAVSLFYKANFSLCIISVFILVSTLTDDKNSKYQRLYHMAFRSDKLKRGLTVREVLISEDARVLDALRQLNANYFYRFTVVDRSFRQVGAFDEFDLDQMTREGTDKPVREAIQNISVTL